MSKEELENCKKEGLCLRCGDSRHYIAGCPYLPTCCPQVGAKVGNIGAKEAVLEEETETTFFAKDTEGEEKA